MTLSSQLVSARETAARRALALRAYLIHAAKDPHLLNLLKIPVSTGNEYTYVHMPKDHPLTIPGLSHLDHHKIFVPLRDLRQDLIKLREQAREYDKTTFLAKRHDEAARAIRSVINGLTPGTLAVRVNFSPNHYERVAGHFASTTLAVTISAAWYKNTLMLQDLISKKRKLLLLSAKPVGRDGNGFQMYDCHLAKLDYAPKSNKLGVFNENRYMCHYQGTELWAFGNSYMEAKEKLKLEVHKEIIKTLTGG